MHEQYLNIVFNIFWVNCPALLQSIETCYYHRGKSLLPLGFLTSPWLEIHKAATVVLVEMSWIFKHDMNALFHLTTPPSFPKSFGRLNSNNLRTGRWWGFLNRNVERKINNHLLIPAHPVYIFFFFSPTVHLFAFAGTGKCVSTVSIHSKSSQKQHRA